MDHEGILSVDLLLATFLLLIIILSTSTLIIDRFNMVDDSQKLAEARSLAENIVGAINQAYAGGEGHVIKIKTPAHINKITNYQVLVNSSGVLVKLENRMGLAYFIPTKISSSPDDLQCSTITLSPAKEYVIMNKREVDGENWIVIRED